jgi:hypothetical protein
MKRFDMKKLFGVLKAGKILLVLFALTQFSCGSSRRSIAVENGWDLIAEKKVNYVRDKDEINVNSRNPFTSLRFQVEDHDIRINDLKIYFQNGDKLEPNIDEQIRAGESSREIELARDGRYIDRIEFKYHTVGNVLKGRGNVLIFGRRYYPGY